MNIIIIIFCFIEHDKNILYRYAICNKLYLYNTGNVDIIIETTATQLVPTLPCSSCVSCYEFYYDNYDNLIYIWFIGT